LNNKEDMEFESLNKYHTTAREWSLIRGDDYEINKKSK